MSGTYPRCGECGGSVELSEGEGRTRELSRGVVVAIPSSFRIPTCVRCGETFAVPEVHDALDKMLAAMAWT